MGDHAYADEGRVLRSKLQGKVILHSTSSVPDKLSLTGGNWQK